MGEKEEERKREERENNDLEMEFRVCETSGRSNKATFTLPQNDRVPEHFCCRTITKFYI